MHTHWAAMGECDGDLTFTVVIREDLSEEVVCRLQLKGKMGTSLVVQ